MPAAAWTWAGQTQWTTISCCWQTHTMCCITVNVLQTKVDAHCDKLATKLVNSACDCRRFRVVASYLSKVSFNLPHLHLVSLLGVTPFEFCQDLWHQKTRFPWLSCGVVCVMLCLAVLAEHWLVTDRHATTAYTMLGWCRAVKILVVARNMIFDVAELSDQQ